MMAQYDINLRDYLRIVRRRRGIVVLVPLLFGCLSFALAFLQAPQPLYRATTVVRVEQAVSFTGLLQELITFNPVGNLETQAALIKGFPVMIGAAKELGFIPRDATPEKIRISPAYLKVIRDLQERVEVKRVENASLIEISATSSDSVEAVRIANSLARSFQEDNFATRNRQVREGREFIEKQLGQTGAKLRQSEDELKGFQQANKILHLPEETRGVLSRLASLEVDHAGIRRATGETEAQLRLLDEGKPPGRQMDLSPDADPVLGKLHASLSDLTLERENLLLTFLPAHPQVRQLDVRIASVRQRLRETMTARRELLRGRSEDLGRSITHLRQEQAAIPKTALDMARMEREVKVSERIFSLLNEKHQEALIKEKELIGEVSLVRPAVGPLEPINPPRALPKAAVGLVIGLVVGFVLAFVIEGLDTSIGAIDEVESLLETSVLGVIPYIDLKQDLSEEKGAVVPLDKEMEEKYTFLLSLFLPGSRIAEAFRVLRTNLLFSRLGGELKTLMVTSSTQTEGKTTVAINLAIALGQLGKRTLLVEADLRNPFLHHAFGIPKDPGLTEVLVGSAKLEEAIRSLPDFILGTAGVEGLIDRRGLDNLFLLPSGHQPPNPTEFLSSEVVTNFLADVRQRYDYVILDCAPILPVADPAILGSRVDGTLLIVRVGTAARAALRRSKALLEAARAKVLGVCLTGVKAEVSPDYAEMGYYQYRYGHHKKRPDPSPGWAGLLTGGGKLKRLALLLPPLVALGIGIWAWSAGHLNLPLLSANSAESLRAVLPPDWVPAQSGRRREDRASPGVSPRSQPSEPPRVAAPTAGGKSGYAIRLPGFPTEEEAQRAVARYQARGLPAVSAEAGSTGEGRRWRVFVGEFKTHDAAEVFGFGLILRGEAEEFQVVKPAPGS